MHSGELKGSFHEAIGPVLRVAQVFGLFSVDGVMSKDVSNIEFKWRSFKTIYSMLFLVLGTTECLLCCRLILNKGLTLSLSSELSFYLISMIGAFYILKLATKWKYLMKLWYDSEKVFLKTPYINCKISMKRKIRLWSALIGFLSLCN
jgi:gustatory receptor